MKKILIASELSMLPTVRVGDIQELQGNLKDLSEINYNKLLNRIQKVGFKYPLYIWIDKGKYYTLDGKQRHRVIEKEYGADTLLPYIEVKAANRIEAKKEILAISSDYGTVTKDGFDEFTGDFEEIDFEEVNEETTFDIWKDKEIESENFIEENDKQKSEMFMAKISQIRNKLANKIKNRDNIELSDSFIYAENIIFEILNSDERIIS